MNGELKNTTIKDRTNLLTSGNKKELARYYICYGYLIMGVLQYLIVLFSL